MPIHSFHQKLQNRVDDDRTMSAVGRLRTIDDQTLRAEENTDADWGVWISSDPESPG